MGGSYALPFVMDPGPYKIAGYVTAAALRSRHNAKPPSVPVLGIYGSEDQPRLDSDRRACFAVPPSPYGCYGNRTQLIVLANAPHPCDLRDAAAARQFTNLVVAFAVAAATCAEYACNGVEPMSLLIAPPANATTRFVNWRAAAASRR